MNKVTVNNNFEFNIETANEALIVNGTATELDVLQLNDKTQHIIHNGKSYNVEVVEINRPEKIAKIKVNGTVYDISVATQLDLLLKQLGMENLNSNKIAQLKAPMPGLVLNILVSEGDEVKKGDSLLVLEAMKMENIIKSPSDATVKKIEVAKGDKIEKNTVLIHFS
ncbi:acetyl-CoA carboxylase biotin carboxyl carrier protein subunit [Nubsella zeaxanthinifaciens]|uniref:acetyl-CoA carboxylase biotin carboxyl carrier protein subunit n=1 Tax=Nubsella zeaxanthinifaciens TaxID=392412 RepID=UPI000DE47473|nr:acetyl-CoA carboxylase biotin carboxyl carrier protein subunit [Nubsella zeaxanthinifaciens]